MIFGSGPAYSCKCVKDCYDSNEPCHRRDEGRSKTIKHFVNFYDKKIREDLINDYSIAMTLRNSGSIMDYTTVQDAIQLEDKKLRNVIVTRYNFIMHIYNAYATIAVDKPDIIGFNPILVRMFLWQFYRDIGLESFGYSLSDMDNVVAEYPNSAVESVHNPFEKIFAWQFMQILICLSFHVCFYYNVTTDMKEEGILAYIFKKFLDEIVTPNMCKRKSR